MRPKGAVHSEAEHRNEVQPVAARPEVLEWKNLIDFREIYEVLAVGKRRGTPKNFYLF